MVAVPTPLPDGSSLRDAATALAPSRHLIVPVTDSAGDYCGVLTVAALAEALADGEHDQATVASITELPDTVRSTDLLSDALNAIDLNEAAAVPVLDEDHQLVGWFTAQAALSALHPKATP
ncbi:CBS domain-containing protein [Antricoccus suffuscus]|uniref:CBS domain-containing protein n=1 Tax=Antricoccus suffuscus TaxID=1629062 RepID=A0A2T1A6W5_9ACTN|nr:CBS domain-containing protein [Antricoccus suffuscus]PRZ44068.1 CBS domain-containing protein [Antricoccus suffuscus]